MNWLNYGSELQKQMDSYIDYLPTIKNDPYLSNFEVQVMTFKLLDEIQFLKLRIMQINRMSREKQHAYVEFRKYKIKSKWLKDQ